MLPLSKWRVQALLRTGIFVLFFDSFFFRERRLFLRWPWLFFVGETFPPNGVALAFTENQGGKCG